MNRLGALFALTIATTFAGCGHDPATPKIELATVMPSYLTLTESTLSTIACSLEAEPARPAPGALAGHACMQHECARDGAVPGSEAVYSRQAQGCTTGYGSLDGATFTRVSGIPEFRGCATRSGPFDFASWPPKSGRLLLVTGDHLIYSTGVPQTPPASVLAQAIRGGRLYQHWGLTTVSFNGTPSAAVNVDHWVRATDPDQRDAAADDGRYHFKTLDDLVLYAPSPWSGSSRTLTGQLRFVDVSRDIAGVAELNQLEYARERCCHPVGGSLTVTANVSAKPEDGAATFELKFGGGECGDATVIDELGRPTPLRLPPC